MSHEEIRMVDSFFVSPPSLAVSPPADLSDTNCSGRATPHHGTNVTAGIRELLAEQRARLHHFREHPHLRPAASTPTAKGVKGGQAPRRGSAVSQTLPRVTVHMRTPRRWNQELQLLLEAAPRHPHEPDAQPLADPVVEIPQLVDTTEIARFMEAFEAEAVACATAYVERSAAYTADPSGDSAMPSALVTPLASARRRASYDSRLSARPRSPGGSMDLGGSTPTNHATLFASSADVADGRALRLGALTAPGAVAVHRKETQLQLRCLAQLLALAPPGVPPLVTFAPRTVVVVGGQAILVQADTPRPAAPSDTAWRDVFHCQELRLALSLVSDCLNLAPYDALHGAGCTGPPGAAAYLASDGRFYCEGLVGLLPHFPPAPNASIGAANTLFLRPEAALATGQPAPSSGAFVVPSTAGRDPGTAAARGAAALVCQHFVPRAAAEILRCVPGDGAELTRLVHRHGVNVSLLALVFRAVGEVTKDDDAAFAEAPPLLPEARARNAEAARRVVFTEMLARACKAHVRSAVDGGTLVTDALPQLMAALCDDDTAQDAWHASLSQLVRVKFAGAGALMKRELSRPFDYVDLELLVARAPALLGVRFTAGVSSVGTSAFHFPLDGNAPRCVPVRLPAPVIAAGPRISSTTVGPARTVRVAGPARQLRRSAALACSTAAAWSDATTPMSPNAAATLPPAVVELSKAYDLMCAAASLTAEAATLPHGSEKRAGLHIAALSHATVAAASDVLQPSQGGMLAVARLLRAKLLRLTDDPAAALELLDVAAAGLVQASAAGTPTPAGPSVGTTPRDRAGPPKAGNPKVMSPLHDEEQSLGGTLREIAVRRAMHSSGAYAQELARSASNVGGLQSRRTLPMANARGLVLFAELAESHEAAGNFAQAVADWRLLLQSTRQLLGATHARVAECHNTLGFALHQLGRTEEALAEFRSGLGILEKTFGPGDIRLCEALNNLACLLMATGTDLDEAAALYRRDIGIAEARHGPAHPNVATAQNNLALCLARSGNYTEAADLLRTALATRRATLGSDHPRVAEALVNLAHVQWQRAEADGDAERVRAHLLPPLAEARAILGDTAGDVDPIAGACWRLTRDGAALAGDDALRSEAQEKLLEWHMA